MDSYDIIRIVESYGSFAIDQESLHNNIRAKDIGKEPTPVIARLYGPEGKRICSELGCSVDDVTYRMYVTLGRMLLTYINYLEGKR